MSPRSAEANEELRAQSRERMLAAALEVFAEKGYHEATISEITARTGVSRGLLTYYFPGKRAGPRNPRWRRSRCAASWQA
ncbi:helix-turn-helix domain-containing protein [Streptomyces sp. NPDC050535]|uniref:helix-turn-helix domain-containing protein n=1 Tax=Streptomyces sp. NPDC050535 TaxID=3365626 RepID=UPI0037A884A4